jgi:hypothetical protein
MAQYNKLAMRMDANKNETGAEVDTTATRWRKLADHQALAELMHDATRLQIDPCKGHMMVEVGVQRSDRLLLEARAASPGR